MDPLGGVLHPRAGAVGVTASRGVSAGRFVSPFVDFTKALVVVNGTLSPHLAHSKALAGKVAVRLTPRRLHTATSVMSVTKYVVHTNAIVF